MVCDQRCDLNHDGVVDESDKAIFVSAYGSKVGDSNWNPACDFNGNGEVDPFDMVHFGESFGCTFDSQTPPPSSITCNGATPHYSSGCAMLLAFDVSGNGKIDSGELAGAGTILAAGRITDDEYAFIKSAYNAGSINSICPGCYGVTPPPITPPENETRTTSLTEGRHTIQVSLSGYDTLNATINVSSTGVTCTVGPCNTQGPPGVTTSGWTVTTYLKSATTTTGYAAWLSSKGGLANVTLSDIFELKDAFIGLTNIGFAPTLPQIMECKDAFIGL